VDPTWEELYGEDMERKPFDDYFARDPQDEDFFDLVRGAAGPGAAGAAAQILHSCTG
jgi:hypothetical protein